MEAEIHGVRERTDTERQRYSQIVSGWSKVHDALSYLERLEDDQSSNVKDDIRTFKLIINILMPSVKCMLKWQTEKKKKNWQTDDQRLKSSLNAVASVLGYVIQGIKSLHLSEAMDLNSYSSAERFVVSNLEELRILEPEMRNLYFVVSRSSKPLAPGEDTEAVRLINLILENMNDILCFKADLILLLKEQIDALQKQLIFLRNFLGFLSEICIWHKFLRDLFSFAEIVAVETACVLYFILVNKMKGENKVQEIKVELLHLVEKIMPFLPDVKSTYVRALEASRSMIIGPVVNGEHALGFFDSLFYKLRELSNKMVNFEVTPKEQTEIILEGLSSVRCYIEETPLNNNKEGLHNFTVELLDLIISLGCFICSNEGFKSMEKLSDLLDKIQFIKSASGGLLIPRSWQYNFPMTNEFGFIDFILVNLMRCLHFNMASTDPLKCLIDTVYVELVALRHDFAEIAELCKKNKELRALFIRYKDVAYHAEYFIDLSLPGAGSRQYEMLGLTDLGESIRQIQRDVKAITGKISGDNLVHNIANIPAVASSEGNLVSIDAAMGSEDEASSDKGKATDQLVGLEDEIMKIKEQLTGGSEELNILSIVGMPGIGKTTFAKSAYEDPAVTFHFHTSAWCSVSQVYQKENLLNKILHQVRRETNRDHENGLDQQVYQSLKGRRYLVILDDIWDIEVWDDLRLSFPNDSNGSRIMLTTRNHDVAFQANSVPYSLRLLSDEESWKLLQVKVFKEETCQPELLEIGKRIAKNCKGLPLAVVLIAGLLKTTERNQDCWEKVGSQVRSYVADYRPGQHLHILELSYMHLPDYLKPCFLYFGAFAEDAEIAAQKLVRLWIAEGFVQQPKVEQNSLEHEAGNYLNDLINRSLVMVAKRSSRGGVKTCHIHDLIREFCLVRAKEERFLLQINRHDELPTFRISEIHEQYRLSIHSNAIPSVKMGHFESRVRTLLFPKYNRMGHFESRVRDLLYGEDNHWYYPTESQEMSEQRFCLFRSRCRCHQQLNGVGVIVKFILLRVLELGAVDIVFEEDFITIARLVHLRYLLIQAYIRKVPEEIASLKNLETFLLSTGTLECTALAKTILSMASLRHLHIGNDSISSFNFQVDDLKSLEKFSLMESLTTISTLRLCCDKDVKEMMCKFPNLQKLKCRFLDSWDASKGCNNFPVLDFLRRLESLKVFFSGKGLHPCNLTFPSSLKKLTLSNSCLPWEEISIIGGLPKLEVLKLLDQAFRGGEWDMKDGEFQELKILKLDFLDLARWNASSEQLPCLEQLVLERCYYLEGIPSAFGEIPTLRMINMKLCNPSAVPSVKQIEEGQQDLGNHQFNVYISADKG